MAQPGFSYPIKPYHVKQPWGVHDPADYAQFGFTDHNGIDLALAPDKKIYAPIDGTIVRRGYQPQGGGNFVGMITEPLDFPAFTNTTPDGRVVNFAAGSFRVLVDFLHCESISVNEGQTVKEGAELAIGDNTGFSTGSHCHTQWRRVTWDGKTINTVDVNDANNSFDPTQFFNRFYAVDTALVTALLGTELSLVQKLFLLIKAHRVAPPAPTQQIS